MQYYNGDRTHLSLNKDAPIPRAVQAVGRALSRSRVLLVSREVGSKAESTKIQRSGEPEVAADPLKNRLFLASVTMPSASGEEVDDTARALAKAQLDKIAACAVLKAKKLRVLKG
jgi:hypothetical protein